MQKPDLPPDEQARLRTLESLNILDTPPEERFDRLTRMARRVFDVPIALVSLVGENRQWFKSCVGLQANETPRDISFCGHAILGNEVFIVTDAKLDERFADNPLVQNDPGIRFYAGCPLRALDGSRLGTLCIIDVKPRSLDADDIVMLKDMSSMVEREFAAVHMATIDELTDITNRRGFMLIAQKSLNLCARQQIPASLVFLDLNRFKSINDSFGHAEGDTALVAFAGLMKRTFRDSDLFARIGGDEFVVLLTNATRRQADESIDKFRTSLDQYNRQAARGYDITFSCGIVEFHAQGHSDVEVLLKEGDALMYERKQ